MATESKLPKLELDDEPGETAIQPLEQPRPLFLSTDIILEVEGQHIHVNKQTLADNSPVFKRMFESDFAEKQMDIISLPGKKYKEFEKFVFFIYNPEVPKQITDDTVVDTLSLAVEYQVAAIQDLCESFLTSKLQRAQSDRVNGINISTLLQYIECAETYDLPRILQLAIDLLAINDVVLLKQADVESCVSGEIWTKILEKRNSLMTTCLKNVVNKGILADVTGILDLISGMEKDSRWCRSELMRRFEGTLSDVCSDYTCHKLTYNTLVDLIIAGERFELDRLLQSAIELASKCTTNNMNKCRRYHQISAENKSKITEKGLYLTENFSNIKPVYLKDI